jgi:hypothetical protein
MVRKLWGGAEAGGKGLLEVEDEGDREGDADDVNGEDAGAGDGDTIQLSLSS